MPIRHVYPRLGEPFALPRDVRATLIHGQTYREEHGHQLSAGWSVREEIRDDLPAGDVTIVQYTYGGITSRYEVLREDLQP